MSYAEALIQKYRELIKQRLEVAERENQFCFLISANILDRVTGALVIPELGEQVPWDIMEEAVQSIINESENKNYSYSLFTESRYHSYTHIIFFLDQEFKKLREKDEEERIESVKNKMLEEKKKKKEERVEKFKDNFAEHTLPGLINSLPTIIIAALSIIFK